jgi:hypothetical protein
MSDVGGTRTNPTFTEPVQTPKGTAQVLTDRISSVECPNCGYHVRAGHRPTVFCRYCKKEITVDTEYRYLQSSNKLGIKSLDWSYHIDCYGKAVHAGKLLENQVQENRAILISQDSL